MRKKILLCLVFFTSLYSEPLELLNKEYSNVIEMEKSKANDEKDVNRYNWISPWSIQGSLSKSSSVSDISTTSKKLSIGFSQDIFRSGGIYFQIDYADKKYNYDILSIKEEHSSLLYEIYDTVLDIDKLLLQIKQNDLTLSNTNIDIFIKKLQYENGKLDLSELNNVLIEKNNIQKESISLKESLKSKYEDLSKLTDLKYEDIELLDFKEISKDQFLNNSFSTKMEIQKEQMLQKSYQKDKSDYMPSISLNGEYGYSQTDSTFETSGDYYSMGLSLLIPLDYFSDVKSGVSYKEYLIQKNQKEISKKELLAQYEQTINQVNVYKQHNKMLEENIKIYDELITIADAKVKSGYTSEYDLEILENTQKSNKIEMQINSIDIQKEYALLYFKMMR